MEYVPLSPVLNSATYWWRTTAGQSQSSTCLCALSHLPKQKQKDNCEWSMRTFHWSTYLMGGFFSTTHPFWPLYFKVIHSCSGYRLNKLHWGDSLFVGLTGHDFRGSSWYSCFVAKSYYSVDKDSFKCMLKIHSYKNSKQYCFQVTCCMTTEIVSFKINNGKLNTRKLI